MTIRERLHQEIERVPDESLGDILRLVESMTRPPDGPQKGEHVLDYLMRNQFDGPSDLSENLDLYASGEKRIDAV